jgi:hypothetical protein
MKNRFSFLLTIWMLAVSSLACGLFTAPGSSAPTIAAKSSQPTATLEAAAPTAAAAVESGNTPSAGTPPSLVPGQDVNGDGKIDICEVIPQSVLETTIGRSLTGPGQPFSDPALGDGCAFDFGKDNDAAYFAYVSIASEQQFNNALAKAVKAEPVTTIGDSAFLNYGPDARQLWVRVGKKAVLAAIGDRENIPAAMIFARYLVDFAAVPADVTAASFAGVWKSVDPKPADINKTPQYCLVEIGTQGDQLTIKFASVCNPVTYIDYMTSQVSFAGSPVVLKIKDFLGGVTSVTLTLNGEILNIKTVYVDKDGNPGVNKSDDFKK